MRFKNLVLFTVIGCALLAFTQDARPCSVPVFRYALERWKPDAYKGIFLYRGAMDENEKVLLQQLQEASVSGEAPLNLVVKAVNVDSFDAEKLSNLFQGPVPDKLPQLAIWYPEQLGKKPPFLKEELTPSLVAALVQSSERRKIAESLINGASVVWVYIPSGDKTKDESALNLIRQELDTALATYSKMPFTILSGAERKRLSYEFPVLTLSRDNPDERIFIETLMKSEPDLYEHTDEPMVFPVFGRGRVLGCLFGEYITAQRIRGAADFLAGACSCEVKAMNPGVDLLVAAPWDMVVMNSFVDEEPVPELTGVMPECEAPQKPEGSTAENSDTRETNSGLFRIYALSLAGVVLIVAISGFIVSQRRRGR